MLTRVSSIFNTVKSKIVSVWRNPESRKEMLMDAAVIAPYVITDVLLYYASYLNFLANLASDPKHPENEEWYSGAFHAGSAIAAILATGLFLAFSDTTSRMLRIKDNEYRAMKEPVRRYVFGVPASLLKVFTGDASLYTYLSKQIDKNASIATASFFAICATPALMSFLWSKHTKSDSDSTDRTARQKRIKKLKATVAYLTSACYAIDVGFVYFHSALNLGKNLGIIDHELSSDVNNPAELTGFVATCAFSIVETVAVYLAFSRLNANMFGLINAKDELDGKGCWPAIEKSWLKKSVGGFAVLFKVFNTATSAYTFFNLRGLPLPANVAIVAYSSLGGLAAQSSLLIFDPLDKAKLVTTQSESSVEEVMEDDNSDISIPIPEDAEMKEADKPDSSSSEDVEMKGDKKSRSSKKSYGSNSELFSDKRPSIPQSTSSEEKQSVKPAINQL